ncbi:UTP--glucose-1-phosphate uridylyltransferase [Piscirickettsia salmonis]|uniref:UTP--glucose-1-phosphate uridylyltransferase n=1 Tax=Piscirickettsia salmonis TaxID=1238 RepID=A0A1L6THM4_PISSA|nr:UTP--glucose-1-phosphate uridylyltransferase GalU [Piscirickettsia salmonis]AKP74776.2 UTP--glucose-1-phosphate uridylyltransferase [Piscirickettsia salmonis LF-89 = ATCC VR-1361]ALB21292.1 UTP--glucose-1-phosphate uridylyltransferase [Piscirickettsia salmonis]ALY04137.1 UTP--glucose-1-phosphate uridylyltransferase [Piscirickettsia salmonis]AMA43692.1 UTP--glucose-1-phosphate uridylyltransferase [Piscirickettsia salmonis]AOS36811.1 UTP--glucose-1-phosphate uridylyltransferase [Pisciricketts
MKVIRKAVLPVAGLGTRFLPATKATPKEMLPVVDKPLIQYAVEEAVAAGITEIIFVTSSNKRAIEDHFDKSFELESRLERAGKDKLLHTVKNILPAGVSVSYIRQSEPLGLGHAVLCAKPLVGEEPFAVLLADDLIDGGIQPCLAQMLEVYQQAANVLAVQPVAMTEVDQYGVVATDHQQHIQAIIEKPTQEKAPSNLAVVGRYILSHRIFSYLERTQKGAGGEIQLTDAIAALLAEQSILAYEFTGKRYDCGSKAGFLEATIAYALKHPELAEQAKLSLKGYKHL